MAINARMVFGSWHNTPWIRFLKPRYRRGVYLFAGKRLVAFMWEYCDTKTTDENPS